MSPGFSARKITEFSARPRDRVCGRRLCLEVDEADSVLYERGLPVQGGSALPWAAGVARTAHGLIPLLDLAALGARFTETTAA